MWLLTWVIIVSIIFLKGEYDTRIVIHRMHNSHIYVQPLNDGNWCLTINVRRQVKQISWTDFPRDQIVAGCLNTVHEFDYNQTYL